MQSSCFGVLHCLLLKLALYLCLAHHFTHPYSNVPMQRPFLHVIAAPSGPQLVPSGSGRQYLTTLTPFAREDSYSSTSSAVQVGVIPEHASAHEINRGKYDAKVRLRVTGHK